MGLFWFFVSLFLVVCSLIVFRSAAKQDRTLRTPVRLIGAMVLVLGLLVLLIDSAVTVAAREVAVKTAFGKVQGRPLGSGWHWVAPWVNVEKFDASVQTLKYYKDEPKDDGNCITVRLGNNTQACVDVTSQWHINHNGDVKNLYLSYKTFENIHDNLVRRQLGSALNEVFGTYDPLAVVDVTAKDVPPVNTKSLQDKVKTILQDDLGTAILIDSVTIPIVHFDNNTEDRLRAFQQAKADTRIAEQNTLTARQQALANQELATQASVKDPGVQYQNCLNLIAQLAKVNQLGSLPPTFNCNQGPQSGVLVQAK